MQKRGGEAVVSGRWSVKEQWSVVSEEIKN
jgi:hypothetical protein